ncbi:MAG: hypothetical protein AAF517_11560, partial [Planctomycetota bacterium]
MLRIQCSECQSKYKVPEAFAGKKTRCRNCGAIIRIPAIAEPEATDPTATPSEEPAVEPNTPKELRETAVMPRASVPPVEEAPAPEPAAAEPGFEEPAVEEPAAEEAAEESTKSGRRGRRGAGKKVGKRAGAKKAAAGGKRPTRRARAGAAGKGAGRRARSEQPAGEASESKNQLPLLIGVGALIVVLAALYFVDPMGWFSPATDVAGGGETPEAGDDDDDDSGNGENGDGEGGGDEVAAGGDDDDDTPAGDDDDDDDDTPAAAAGGKGAFDLLPADSGLVLTINPSVLVSIAGKVNPTVPQIVTGQLATMGIEFAAVKRIALGLPIAELLADPGKAMAMQQDPSQAMEFAEKAMVVVEGGADKSKLSLLLKSQGFTDGSDGGLVRAAPGEPTTAVSFLGDGVAVIGGKSSKKMAADVSSGKTKSLRGSKLAGIVGDLDAAHGAWLAIALPDDLKIPPDVEESLKLQLSQFGFQEIPIPKGILIAVEPTDDAVFNLTVSIQVPTELEAKKIFSLIPMLKLMGGQEVAQMLEGLKGGAEGDRVVLRYPVTKEMAAMAMGALQQGFGPGSAPGGDFGDDDDDDLGLGDDDDDD